MKFKSLFVAMLIVLMAAGMAFAQEKSITPYISARMWLGLSHADAGGGTDTEFMEHALITSRFGLNGKLDKLSMKVEVGLKDNSYGKGLYLRHIYATYKTGDLEILFGQTWTPYFYLMGCFASDFVGLGYGATFDGRLPQVRLSYAGIYVAAIQPKGIVNGTDEIKDDTYNDNYMPKFAVGYEYKSDMLEIGPGFAINFTKTWDSDTDSWTNVTSFIGYVHGKVKLGAPFIKFNATFAQNPGDFGIINNSAVLPLQNPNTDSNAKGADDVYVFEGFVEAGYKFGMGTVSTGVGYVRNFETDGHRMAVFAQFLIPVQKYFTIAPTVIYFEQFDGQGREVVAGVKLQADI